MKTAKLPQYFGKDLEAMSFAINYHKWILEEIRPFFGNRVAEVGAGTGNFSKLLLEHVEHLVAFEPSENMYPLLIDRLGRDNRIQAVNGFFSNKYKNLKDGFDSIVYVNVLEHIEDDRKELSCIYSALRNQGYALVFVPALPFLYSNLDRRVGHFRRYNKKELVRLMKEVGFNIVKARYFDIAGIVPWYIAFVVLGRTIRSGNVSFYDRMVVPIMKKVERIIEPPIGKNILIVAQKS